MTKLINGTNHHTISSDGVVINTKTNHTKTQWIGANGYYYVDIHEDGNAKKVAVHRLLALHFIPNPDNKRTVNHIDGNKLNNDLSNLEWSTDAENIQHAYDTNLHKYRRNHSLKDYEDMLINRFLKGESITSISQNVDNNLTQLSYHLREAAERLQKLSEYEAMLIQQKVIRAKQAGISKRKKITLQMIDKVTKEVLSTFNSIAEAREFLGKKSSGPITNAIAGRAKSAYGYLWVKL